MSNEVKSLPAAPSVEVDVLGSILAEDETWWRHLFRMGGDTTPELFHDPNLRLIVTIAAQSERERTSVSVSSLVHRLLLNPLSQHMPGGPEGFMATLQGQGRLRDLTGLQSAVTTLLAERHSRKLVLGGKEIERKLLDRDITSTEAAAEMRLLSMESGVEAQPRRFGDVIEEMENEDTARVLWRSPSGIATLDNGYLRGGFEPGRLYIVGARPKVGKTTALINFMLSALQNDIVVVFASLEINEAELYTKMLASQSQVDATKLQQLAEHKITLDDFPPEERAEISLAKKEIKAAPLYTMFSSEITNGITSVLNKTMAVQAMFPPGQPLILFVDYIQKLAKSVSQSDRSAEIGDIAWQSKRFSQDYGVSVVMPAQLRRPESEDSGMPAAHHLKETGSLEQDADVVILLNRPRLQNPDLPESLMHFNVALNRVGKSTQGEEEWVQAHCDLARQTITDANEQADRDFEGYESNATGMPTERRSTRSVDDEAGAPSRRAESSSSSGDEYEEY